MGLETEKIQLAKMLLETEDRSLIKEVRDLFRGREKDFWDEIPEYIKEGIRKSQEQAKSGHLTPDAIVREKFNKYL